jgi:hypothetical protein
MSPNRYPRASVHDLSPVLRDRGVRASCSRPAALAWFPFVHGCVTGMLPNLPTFDGWGLIWPELQLKWAALGVAVAMFVPPQWVCGVLPIGFGPLLDRTSQRD